jgi:hypothetical protein
MAYIEMAFQSTYNIIRRRCTVHILEYGRSMLVLRIAQVSQWQSPDVYPLFEGE